MKQRKNQRRSNLKSLVLGGTVFGLSLMSAPADGPADPVTRDWKSKDGEHSVEASLVAFNATTKRVTLKKKDSSSVEVPLSRLSEADQAFIKEHAPKLSRAKEAVEAIQLYGITWQPEIEEALKLAGGDSTSADSRPVMWFRVLGKLDDGM